MSELKAFHLPGAWGLVSVSPFCLKLDSFFRMAGIEHQSITAATPFPGPKKKAPWIEYRGQKLGDSTLIIDFLRQEFDVDLDAHLSDEQRGQAIAIQRLIEENLYWAMVYDRWVRDENWPILKGTVLGNIPAPLRMALTPIARKGVKRQLAGHGMGLHTAAEIEAISRKDIDALAGILGDKDWFMGDRISFTDAVVYSLLANIAFVEFSSPMKAMISAHSSLVDWLARFKNEVYPEQG